MFPVQLNIGCLRPLSQLIRPETIGWKKTFGNRLFNIPSAPDGVSNVTRLWQDYGIMDEAKGSGGRDYARKPRSARVRKPLSAADLEEMALAYVARLATSAQGLSRYCHRKLRERGWAGAEEGAAPPDIDALVARFVANRYVDDREFARARTGSLLRRGYGARRVEQALGAAGVADENRIAVPEGEARRAALQLARKRRFGPFGPDGCPPEDRAVREKQVAAMLRAGHTLDAARALVEAGDPESALAWADSTNDED